MLCILKAIFAWVAMLLVSTNLIGFVVRGLWWTPPTVEASTDRLRECIARDVRRMTIANAIITLLSIVVAAAYLYALFHFWNGALAAAAVLLMLARAPDLFWEIRTGRKVARSDMPKGTVYSAAPLFCFGALPLIWYALCKS